MYKESALAFDCRNPKKHAKENSSIGVSAQVLLPDHPEGLDVDRSKLAKGAAELVADTARYVSSTVLKCSGPHIPNGVPAQKPQEQS